VSDELLELSELDSLKDELLAKPGREVAGPVVPDSTPYLSSIQYKTQVTQLLLNSSNPI
jgi:hypothetical protein